MDDNVLDFKSRRPLTEIVTEEAESVEVQNDTHRDGCVALLEQCLVLAKTGDLTDFVILASHKPSGLLFTDMCLHQTALANKSFAYVGALECLKLEMSEVAQMTPVVMSDGSILDPHTISEEGEFE